MEVKTKFNIGDIIFYTFNKEIKRDIIKDITILLYKTKIPNKKSVLNTKIIYRTKSLVGISENIVYRTKKEAEKHFQNDVSLLAE